MIFFPNAKSKIHINSQHLFKLATSTEYKRDIFSTSIDYLCEFWILHYENFTRFKPNTSACPNPTMTVSI